MGLANGNASGTKKKNGHELLEDEDDDDMFSLVSAAASFLLLSCDHDVANLFNLVPERHNTFPPTRTLQDRPRLL